MTKKRTVYCVGTWPEDNYTDFIVFDVQPGESDESAIERAKQAYSPSNSFYVKETIEFGKGTLTLPNGVSGPVESLTVEIHKKGSDQ